jgi:hypothetical protein
MTTHDEKLRRILTAEAQTVEVAPDALEVIRKRIARRRARFWPARLPRGLALVAFTGGTAVVAAALVALALIGVPRTEHQATPGTTAVPPSANLPVYYVGQTTAGPRLYREYHPLLIADQSPGAKAEAAVETMLTPKSAFDPDYTTRWPVGVSVHAVRVSADTATVELVGLPGAFAPDPVDRQQLVWTVTATTGVPKVRLLLDGHDTGGPYLRGSAVDVLAPVWLIDPQQDAPIGHTVTVRVAGSVTDGLVRVRVRTADGALVRDDPVRLSAAAPDRGEATETLTLPTGRYVVEAYVRAPDGTEQFLDAHRIAVP